MCVGEGGWYLVLGPYPAVICSLDPPEAIIMAVNLGVKLKISVQVRVFGLADPVIELQFKNDFGGVRMFGQGIWV